MLQKVTRKRLTTANWGMGIKKTPGLVYLGHDDCYVRHDLGFVIYDTPVKNPTFVRNILPLQNKDLTTLQVDIHAHDRYVGVFSLPEPTVVFGVDVTESPATFYMIDTQDNKIKNNRRTFYSTPLIADRIVHFHGKTLNDVPAFFVRFLNAITVTWFRPRYENLLNPYHFLNPMLLTNPGFTVLTTVPSNLQSDLGVTEVRNDDPKILLMKQDGTVYTHDGVNFVEVVDPITTSNFDSYAMPYSRYIEIADSIHTALGDELYGALSKGFCFPCVIHPSLFQENVSTTQFILTLRKEQRTVLLLGEL